MLFPLSEMPFPVLLRQPTPYIAGLATLDSPAHSLAPSKCSKNKLSIIGVLPTHAELLADQPSFLLEISFSELDLFFETW